MVFNLAEKNSLANQFIAELSNVEIQQERHSIRRNLELVGELLADESSQTLDYELVEVEPPLGVAPLMLPTSRVVLGTVLRAGLPFHQGMLHYFDAADNAFVSAYRRHHKDGSFDIQLDYVSTPDLDGCVLVLCDPMLATGASVNLALQELLRFGTPAAIHVATVIASSAGLDVVRRRYPKARIWAGAVDEELTAKSYIVPGLGDAGDLAYGDKK